MTATIDKRRNGSAAGIEVVAETVTPDLAGDWLSSNTKNRRLRESRVKRLAQIIREGEWQPYNGETIKFSRKGQLIDGQHRLAAVVMANLPIQTLVARGIDEEAFRTIDSGVKRSTSDTLYLLGEEHETQLARTLNALFRWNRYKRFQYGEGVTTTELLDTLDRHPAVRDSVPVAAAIYRKLPGAPVSLMACLHYVFRLINGDEADEFFTRLRDGTNLSATDPVYHLRERLGHVRPTAGNGFRYQDEVGALIIKCWNAYRKGQLMHRLTYRSGTDGYPEPE